MKNLVKCLGFGIALGSTCIFLLLHYIKTGNKFCRDFGISLICSLVVSLFFAFVFLDLSSIRKIFFG